jgi:hypothetical protein
MSNSERGNRATSGPAGFAGAALPTLKTNLLPAIHEITLLDSLTSFAAK